MAGERVDYTAAAVDAAEFEEALDRDERAIRQRDAFEKVNHLLRQLGMG